MIMNEPGKKPDISLRLEIDTAHSREELLELAHRSYLSFDHAALKICIEKYESLYYDEAMNEYRWLMETSCW